MPQAAEVDRLVLALEHRDDEGCLVETLDEGIVDRRAERRRRGELLRGRQLLVTEEDHQMVEKGAADGSDRLRIERARQIDAADLGAERTGDRRDGHARAHATPATAPSVGPISRWSTRSANGSSSVGSRLRITRRAPFCRAMAGNPAAG